MPPLQIAGIPSGTETLALTLEDPDAPGGTFVHLVMWNIPPAGEIPEGSVPEGAAFGANSAGRSAYSPPCPPGGTHRYVFTLYALDGAPGLPSGSVIGALREAMRGHVLAQASLTGRCSRG
jgi:Raf kinase inhibitor-like YbhB/YbcL family protein